MTRMPCLRSVKIGWEPVALASRPTSRPGPRKRAPGPSSRRHRAEAAGVIHTDFERGFIRAEVARTTTSWLTAASRR
jgi:hypothetical protein